MSYTAKGVITHINEKVSGTNAKGAYEYQTFMVETTNEKNFKQPILFTAFNKTVEYLDKKKVGDNVEVGFSIENKGQKFNNVTAYLIK